MNAQRIAGMTALIAGAIVAIGMLAQAVIGPAAFGTGGWPMGPGMMGGRGMGPGMMGFGTSGPASSAIPNAPEVRVQAANFSFTPNEVHLPKNADVNLTFTNPSSTGVVHDLTVPALGIHVVANPGETKTVGLRSLPAGRYDAYCSVPGHADSGMRATVVVE
ncbi:MAG TPA: cupredoxin domain-containing protein [Candidatus Limnocylindria bacterium]|nr:cupredoxin domain-containing protein [Candidatus Limnocylindria bacterium]